MFLFRTRGLENSVGSTIRSAGSRPVSHWCSSARPASATWGYLQVFIKVHKHPEVREELRSINFQNFLSLKRISLSWGVLLWRTGEWSGGTCACECDHCRSTDKHEIWHFVALGPIWLQDLKRDICIMFTCSLLMAINISVLIRKITWTYSFFRYCMDFSPLPRLKSQKVRRTPNVAECRILLSWTKRRLFIFWSFAAASGWGVCRTGQRKFA